MILADAVDALAPRRGGAGAGSDSGVQNDDDRSGAAAAAGARSACSCRAAITTAHRSTRNRRVASSRSEERRRDGRKAMWGDWRKKKRWKRGEDKREREMIGARACNASARSPFLFSLAFSRAWRGVEPGAPRGRVWIGEGACVAAMASLRALSLSTGRERHLPPIARALLLYRLPGRKR